MDLRLCVNVVIDEVRSGQNGSLSEFFHGMMFDTSNFRLYIVFFCCICTHIARCLEEVLLEQFSQAEAPVVDLESDKDPNNNVPSLPARKSPADEE